MTCIFCRSRDHTKSACTHPNTQVKEREINGLIQSTYAASQLYSLTRDEFNICIKMILTNKFTVIHLKMAIEDFKKKLNETTSVDGNKSDLIIVLTIMACRFYNYIFAPLSQGHIINPYQLTNGIREVTRQILHPRVGNLQPRSSNPIIGRVSLSTLDGGESQNSEPVNNNQSQTPSETIRVQSSQISQTSHINRLYYSVSNQQPGWIERANNGWIERTNTNNNMPISSNRPFTHQPQPPPPPPPSQYTVHKTDKKCDEMSECAVCFNTLDNQTYVYLECSHEFCKTCIKGCLTRNLYKCPLCRASITNVYTQNPIVSYSI